MAFSKLHTLKVHRLDHYGVTPYSCDKCEMKFSTKSKLFVHKAGKTVFFDETVLLMFYYIGNFKNFILLFKVVRILSEALEKLLN